MERREEEGWRRASHFGTPVFICLRGSPDLRPFGSKRLSSPQKFKIRQSAILCAGMVSFQLSYPTTLLLFNNNQACQDEARRYCRPCLVSLPKSSSLSICLWPSLFSGRYGIDCYPIGANYISQKRNKLVLLKAFFERGCNN